MKNLIKPALQPLLLALVAATTAPPAAAADKTWHCADGVYTSAACWTPRGLPIYPDALQVGPVGGADTLLRYTFGTHNVASMVLDAPDFRPGQPGAVRVELSGGRFNVLGPLVVADRGWASLALLPGSNLSVRILTLGEQAGANGSLAMTGGGLGANSVLLGLAGAGQIDLAAGSLITGTLKVWSGSGSSALNLTGGLLAASSSASVGGASGQYGLIDQTGGLLRAPVLSVGDGGAGVYLLRGSGQLASAQQRVGVGGEGLFQQQDAGSRNTATQLVVGVTRPSSYELLGGELVTDSTWVGQGASGRFVTDGGTHRVGDLQIGTDPRAGGGYQLSSGLLAAVSVRVGATDAVGAFVQNGGTHQVDDALEIGAGSRHLLQGSGGLINGAAGTVTGSGTVNSRLINAGSLVLGAADRLTVGGVFINTGLIDLGAASASLAGNVLTNSGLVAGRGRIANAVDNLAGGRIQANGGVLALGGALNNQGLLVAGPGGTLLLQGGLTQQGRLQLEGGTLDLAGRDLVNGGVIGGFGSLRGSEVVNQRQILFSGGASQVHANLDQQAGAQVVVSGGAVATFHGTLRARAGSELRVSQGSGAVFFAAVSQEDSAAFTGSGTSWFEAGLSVGSSPVDGGVGGDALFGAHNLYRAEIGGLLPGSGHDRFSAAGHLQLGGELQLSWWGGFSPQAGQRFDLFDWASRSGQFSHIDLAAAPLTDGLRWDASRLYLDGSLAVAAVPEPGTWLLMAGGLLGLNCRRRPMRFQSGRDSEPVNDFTGSES